MARYIDADMAIEMIENDCLEQVYYSKQDAIDCIEGMPKADVVEVKRGEWIAEQKGVEYCEFVCSICNSVVGKTDQFDETEVTQFSEWYSYCPNCGADMRGAE